MMAPLIDAAMSRRRTVLSILVLLLISGFYAYMAIPKESEPDIDIPQIYVSMSLEGISPSDAERLLLRPMEQELSTIEGLKEMRSSAYQGGGFVLLEFWAGFNKDQALDDVRKGVDQARPKLPDGVDEPIVTEVNFSLFPVLVVTLSGDVPERTLLRLARDLKDRIEGLGSVLEAPIAGDREELVEIIVDPALIESYGLDGTEILNFFQRSNRLVAAGNLDTGAGRFAVDVPGLFETAWDVMAMPVRSVGDSTIRIGDIAEIRRTFKDPENFAWFNGERAIALEVVKRSGENVIDTIAAVRAIVEEERHQWPEGISVNFTQDRSEDIRTMLADLQNNMISAILLVMIVVVAALGLRSAGLVGIAIPGAFLTGILVIFLLGLTVNVVVLFALILSVGMLVDGAIVVTEFADRKMVEGLDRKDAYTAAAKRMAWPITASAATTLAAFAPLLFWPGLVGEFMKYLPLTLICVLTASLAMALIFVPVLGSLFGKPGIASNPEAMRALAASEEGDLHHLRGLTGWYVGILEKALDHAGKVIIGALILLVGVQILYAKVGRGVEFFPDIEPSVATVLVHARGNLSIHEKDALVREVEQHIYDIDGLKTIYTRSGASAMRGGDLAEDVIGQIQLEFHEWDQRRPANEILEEVRQRTATLPGLIIETQAMQGGPPTGKDIQIELSSRFPELLPPAVERVRAAFEELGNFRDLEDSRPMPGIDWKLEVNRAQASKFGIDISMIGEYVRMVTNGFRVADYRPDDSDDEIDIVLRFPGEDRTLNRLDQIRITTPQGSVPIANFVDRQPQPAQGTIERVNQRRILTVKANVAPGDNVTARVDEIRAWFAANQQDFDPRVNVNFRGQDEDQREAQEFLGKAFIVALFVMAIILVTQFNSFYSALLILSAVIMSTIGVFIGLMVVQQPFGIVMSGIGVIALAGIIVNNNIVLIDTFDVLRSRLGEHAPVREIILRTGAQRLRPVLLTTITTALGLIPMVLQINIDFLTREVSYGAPSTQWWVQLATAVVFGLLFSTVLTLIVTPCALMLRDRAARFRKSLGNRMRRLHPKPSIPTTEK